MPEDFIKLLFVPGRLCLVGEHSDWAGGHRRQNSDIEKGYAIVVPTNQGNYARVKPIPEKKLVYRSSNFPVPLEVSLEGKDLLKIAEGESDLRFVAGTAYEILMNHNGHGRKLSINKRSHGIEIDNYKTDLPIKKGLSSSASVCVLVARAFKEIYDLPLSTRGLMNLAYNGETNTSSRCGRLDQACAYPHPIFMTFDADKIQIEEVKPMHPLYLAIVDLNSKKDTIKILAELNKGFPFPTTDLEKRKHEYLGRINKNLVSRALESIRQGDSKKLGDLMTESQEKFDEYLSPCCPDELTAPKLHQVLSYTPIQSFIYGGKGVGSQGDGCAQLMARDNSSQLSLIETLNSDKELNVHAIPLTIHAD